MHQFFIQAARLYPTFSDHERHIMPQPVETVSSSESDEEEPQYACSSESGWSFYSNLYNKVIPHLKF